MSSLYNAAIQLQYCWTWR